MGWIPRGAALSPFPLALVLLKSAPVFLKQEFQVDEGILPWTPVEPWLAELQGAGMLLIAASAQSVRYVPHVGHAPCQQSSARGGTQGQEQGGQEKEMGNLPNLCRSQCSTQLMQLFLLYR